jgi:hypothetical protein
VNDNQSAFPLLFDSFFEESVEIGAGMLLLPHDFLAAAWDARISCQTEGRRLPCRRSGWLQ